MRGLWRLWRELREPEGIYCEQVRAFGALESEIQPLNLPPIQPLKAKVSKRRKARPRVLQMKREA